MLVRVTPPFRKRREYSPKQPAAAPPAPPAPPVLLAASCDGSPTITLVFDRPVDVSGMDVALIRLDDGELEFTYVGFGEPMLVDPVTVQLYTTGVDDYAGPGQVLTAAAGNGIVAADGGLPWAGVSGVELPFGSGEE